MANCECHNQMGIKTAPCFKGGSCVESPAKGYAAKLGPGDPWRSWLSLYNLVLTNSLPWKIYQFLIGKPR